MKALSLDTILTGAHCFLVYIDTAVLYMLAAKPVVNQSFYCKTWVVCS